MTRILVIYININYIIVLVLLNNNNH